MPDIIRPDLTPILVSLKANDWIEVIERSNESEEGEEFHEGKFRLYTATHLYMLIHQGDCRFIEGRIALEDIISITHANDKCPDIIAKA